MKTELFGLIISLVGFLISLEVFVNSIINSDSSSINISGVFIILFLFFTIVEVIIIIEGNK